MKNSIYRSFKKTLSFCSTLIILFSCSEDSSSVNTNAKSNSPTISCPKDLRIEVFHLTTDTIVKYTTPTGFDDGEFNISLVSGAASGSSFPIGTSTVTHEIVDNDAQKSTCSFDIVIVQKDPPITPEDPIIPDEPISSDQPHILDGNIAPAGKKWVLDTEQSDEFDDNTIDNNKWRLTSSGGWIGRAPGLFLTENVSESDGHLRIKATKLENDRTINNNIFTHGGGYVEGLHPMNVGLYLECRMKANKTFLSSTFWLNNRRGEGSGCDVRVTELDIQECVGTLTGTSALALRGWDKIMHSNTHSRSTSCPSTVTGSSPKWSEVGENVAENYHVYAAWWKSPREIICYLDGKEIHTLTPKADFNLNSYLRLVVETYDWNPTPADGGISKFSELERSTLYDWVRIWKLEDE